MLFTLKNGCFLMSSASLSLAPNLLSGFLLNNYMFTINTVIFLRSQTFLIIDIASEERNLGYLTTSLTIESNTSSSSSPGNGD